MANQEHLDLLKQGLETWNQRRRKEQAGSEAYLSTADLSEADLSGAWLKGANLFNVNLRILGRFTPPRKVVLDALKDALRGKGYVPILFDFERPSSQDVTETVSTLAHLSRFILVDLTDPSSAPYEVGMIASTHIRPIQALFHPSDEGKRVFAMFPDLIRRYHWVLPPYEYQDQAHLLATLQEQVIATAERKAQELEKR